MAMGSPLSWIKSELNKYNICHNDMKPLNIVRKIDGTYSLIDFSLTSTISKIINNSTMSV